MQKEIVFFLGSLNDPHFQKRVEVFIKHGYIVKVFGFLREGRDKPSVSYDYISLGTLKERHYFSRFVIYFKSFFRVRKEAIRLLCFYSSLDIALFARLFIRSDYIYEVCDLTELSIANKFIRNVLVRANRRCINKSKLTILTSQGFAKFFSDIMPHKYEIIPNRVSPDCQLVSIKRKPIVGTVRIGFVGVIRYETTYRFVSACVGRNDVEVHLYGIYSIADTWSSKIQKLVEENDNMYYHGKYTNPVDLPSIYEKIDLLLCAYPPSNGRLFAEPNKLYESIFFNCPIIVSKGTFLGNKVEELGIGFAIDSMNNESITTFLNSLPDMDYVEKVEYCSNYSKEECIDRYDYFFLRLENWGN